VILGRCGYLFAPADQHRLTLCVCVCVRARARDTGQVRIFVRTCGSSSIALTAEVLNLLALLAEK
jgi:hypothetical protein